MNTPKTVFGFYKQYFIIFIFLTLIQKLTQPRVPGWLEPCPFLPKPNPLYPPGRWLICHGSPGPRGLWSQSRSSWEGAVERQALAQAREHLQINGRVHMNRAFWESGERLSQKCSRQAEATAVQVSAWSRCFFPRLGFYDL